SPVLQASVPVMPVIATLAGLLPSRLCVTVPLLGTLADAIGSLNVRVRTSPVSRRPLPFVLEMPVNDGGVVATLTAPDAGEEVACTRAGTVTVPALLGAVVSEVTVKALEFVVVRPTPLVAVELCAPLDVTAPSHLYLVSNGELPLPPPSENPVSDGSETEVTP